MPSKFIRFQDHQVHYATYGQGKPVVLIHGFGEDSRIWEKQIAALGENFSLIVPDIPGSGQSHLVPGANIDTYASVIHAIIEAELEDSPVHSIIGHSMGGYITLAFAEKYPEQLHSFGLFHSSAFADDEQKIQTRKKAIEFIRDRGAIAFLKTSIPGLFTKQFAAQEAEQVEQLIEKSAQFSNNALVQYYEAMIARPDRTAVLNSFGKPVLFIIGEQDAAIPLKASLAQCYLPAESHVHILPDVAHMGMWEAAEECNFILLDFLRGVGQ